MEGNSDNLIQILQRAASSEVPQNKLSETLGVYKQLPVGDQNEIRTRLCKYFLSRNQ